MNYDEIEQLRARHPAWALLSSRNVALVLSFLGRVFVDANESNIAATRLIRELDDEIYALNRRLGEGTFPRPAKEYLDDWADPKRAWLRKYYPAGSDEPHYDLTPAVEKAIAWVDDAILIFGEGFRATSLEALTWLHDNVAPRQGGRQLGRHRHARVRDPRPAESAAAARAFDPDGLRHVDHASHPVRRRADPHRGMARAADRRWSARCMATWSKIATARPSASSRNASVSRWCVERLPRGRMRSGGRLHHQRDEVALSFVDRCEPGADHVEHRLRRGVGVILVGGLGELVAQGLILLDQLGVECGDVDHESPRQHALQGADAPGISLMFGQ